MNFTVPQDPVRHTTNLYFMTDLQGLLSTLFIKTTLFINT